VKLLDQLLPVGPRSVLWGAHQFLIHPLFVAAAWTRLYGFPRDPRLWVAFFVHDLGYLFLWCKNMDGPEGERHVEWGAAVMHRLFDANDSEEPTYWRDLLLYHSRFRAKQDGRPYSRLCVADKLSVALEPWWLYLPRVIASGEVHEYIALAGGKNNSKYKGEPNSKYESMQLEPDVSVYLGVSVAAALFALFLFALIQWLEPMVVRWAGRVFS